MTLVKLAKLAKYKGQTDALPGCQRVTLLPEVLMTSSQRFR